MEYMHLEVQKVQVLYLPAYMSELQYMCKLSRQCSLLLQRDRLKIYAAAHDFHFYFKMQSEKPQQTIEVQNENAYLCLERFAKLRLLF